MANDDDDDDDDGVTICYGILGACNPLGRCMCIKYTTTHNVHVFKGIQKGSGGRSTLQTHVMTRFSSPGKERETERDRERPLTHRACVKHVCICMDDDVYNIIACCALLFRTLFINHYAVCCGGARFAARGWCCVATSVSNEERTHERRGDVLIWALVLYALY